MSIRKNNSLELMTINGLKNLRHVLHEHRLCRKKEVATFSCTLMISQSKVASAVSYMSQKRIPSLTTVSSKHVMMAKTLRIPTKNVSIRSTSISIMQKEPFMAQMH
jgi:hypothetical protein